MDSAGSELCVIVVSCEHGNGLGVDWRIIL